MKNSLVSKFYTLCFAAIGTYLAFIAISSLYSSAVLYWMGMKTEGTVIDVERVDRKGSDDLFYPRVRYFVNEQSYIISSRHGFNHLTRPKTYDNFVVYYDAKEPSNATIYSIWEAFLTPIFKLAGSVFLFYVSGLGILRGNKGSKNATDKNV